MSKVRNPNKKLIIYLIRRVKNPNKDKDYLEDKDCK